MKSKKRLLVPRFPQRKARLVAATFLVAACVVSCQSDKSAPQSSNVERPNIVLVLADDQTWHDSGAYGNSDVRTPNIDRLAGEGVSFTNAYTGTAMCSPTRQQLYTGLYPVRSGAYPNSSEVRPGTKSIAHYLSDLGYRVGITGKQHFGPADAYPFEVIGGTGDGLHNKVDEGAVNDFINDSVDEPFLLIVASNYPHFPWPDEATDYDPDELTVPDYLVDTPETRSALARYYREVSILDGQLGAVDASINRAGLKENTVFIYTSEHGAMFPHGKWTLYDPGIKTAMVIRWPGVVEAGSSAHALIHYTDVVPTLVEIAGGQPPDVDGQSFMRVLKGETDQHQTHVFGIHTNRGICNGTTDYPIRSVRSDRFKLILNLLSENRFTNNVTETNKGNYYESWREKGEAGDQDAMARYRAYVTRPAEELYDLTLDPLEMNNLAADPAYAAIKRALRTELNTWMAAQGDEGVATEIEAPDHLSPDGLHKYNLDPKCRPPAD